MDIIHDVTKWAVHLCGDCSAPASARTQYARMLKKPTIRERRWIYAKSIQNDGAFWSYYKLFNRKCSGIFRHQKGPTLRRSFWNWLYATSLNPGSVSSSITSGYVHYISFFCHQSEHVTFSNYVQKPPSCTRIFFCTHSASQILWIIVLNYAFTFQKRRDVPLAFPHVVHKKKKKKKKPKKLT